jgi:Domain of unknown function (DUF4262)
MCLMCDGWSADEVNADLHDRIVRFGWTMIGVDDSPAGQAWTYTVGLADRGHAELVVAGVAIDRAMVVLSDLATRVIEGQVLDADRVTCLDDQEAALRDVHPTHVERGLVGAWQSYYAWRGSPAPPLRVQQVVLPDTEFCRCHGGRQPRLDLAASTFGSAGPNRAERRVLRRRRGAR